MTWLWLRVLDEEKEDRTPITAYASLVRSDLWPTAVSWASLPRPAAVHRRISDVPRSLSSSTNINKTYPTISEKSSAALRCVRAEHGLTDHDRKSFVPSGAITQDRKDTGGEASSEEVFQLDLHPSELPGIRSLLFLKVQLVHQQLDDKALILNEQGALPSRLNTERMD